jgi:SAM-dependent methyltransferase
LLGPEVARDGEMVAHDWDRIASDYFTEVVSPFEEGVPRRLLRVLDNVAGPERKVAADLGCGIGTLLPTLAARFHRVYGIDFSRAMLTRARAACPAQHVTLHRADLADLGRFREQLDVAVTVNAVLTPDSNRLDRIFGGLREVLRPDGALVGIFPAMEAVLYQGFLIHERERRRVDPARARRRTSRLLERASYDFVHGTYSENGHVQKFFYAFELRARLRGAGFTRVRLGRLEYPWRSGLGRYETFPGEPPMWDWLIRAR